MPDYYNRQGWPISLEEWSNLFACKDYQIVAQWEHDGILVSTVWLGLDHQFLDGPPLIFETMVFRMGDDEDEDEQTRYATEQQALAGHQATVQKYMVLTAE